MFDAMMNQAIGHGCNWNDVDVPYSELESSTSRNIVCCCNLLHWTSENKLYKRSYRPIVIDITQLGCPELADISLRAISCTFACHKSKQVCALRKADSLAQWLNDYILSLQYAKCPPQPCYH